MTDRTGAERQRRYRLHKAGDHSLCDPARRAQCAGADAGVTVTPTLRRDGTEAPPGLRSTGRRIWRELAATGAPADRLALVAEAARIADRLDQLDAFLRGDSPAWLSVETDDNGRAFVVVDRALSEARQQALALSRILTDLRAGAKQQSEQGGAPNVLDQLATRRAEREAEARRRADATGS